MPLLTRASLQEMFQNAIVQKSYVVDFQIKPVQCEGCRHVASEQTWQALLQVRQAADHKRIFFLHEQVQISSSSSSSLKCPAVVAPVQCATHFCFAYCRYCAEEVIDVGRVMPRHVFSYVFTGFG
jgi:hypothetical protein